MQFLIEHASLCLHSHLALLPHVTGIWTERHVELGALRRLVLDHEGAVETGLVLEDERGTVLVAPPRYSDLLGKGGGGACLAQVDACAVPPRHVVDPLHAADHFVRLFSHSAGFLRSRSLRRRRARAFPLSSPETSQSVTALLAGHEQEGSRTPRRTRAVGERERERSPPQ